MRREYSASPPRSAVGRADLLRALALREIDTLTLDDDGQSWFGYRRQEEEPPLLHRVEAAFESTYGVHAGAAPAPTARRLPLRMRSVLGIVHRETRPAPAAPPAVEAFSPLDAASAAPPSPVRRIGYEDLIPAARLLPALRRWLGTARSGPPDFERLARRLAVADPPRHLPRKRLPCWHPDLVVVLDFSPRLWPYREDMHRLAERLLRLCGQHGVSLRIVDRGPPGAWTDWRDEQNPARMAPVRDWIMPPAGTPVLIVGDLGLLMGAGVTQRWQGFIERLRRARARPLALVPLGAEQLSADLTRGLPVLRWSPDARLHPVRAHGPGRPEPEGLEDLLAMAAVWRRIDPPLLRALRRLHPATPLDAGLEGAFWRHSQVVAGQVARVEGPERPRYLERFRQLAPALQATLERLRARHHAHLRAVLNHEECLAFAAQAHPSLRSDPVLAKAVAASETFMRRLTVTLQQGDAESNAAGWREAARGIETRADTVMAERGKDWLLPLVAARMRRERAMGLEPVAPEWADPATLAEALGQTGPGVNAWLVRDAASTSLVLQGRPAGIRQSPLGGPDAALPLDAGGLRLRIGDGPVVWHSPDRLPLRVASLDTDSAIRLETSREKLTIAPLVRPRGSAGWHCDVSGLCVNTPILGGQSASFNEQECTKRAILDVGFLLTARGPHAWWRGAVIGETPKYPGRSFRPFSHALDHTAGGMPYLPSPDFDFNESGNAGQKSSQASVSFGLDAPYGVYADLNLETSHGRATQRLRWIEPGTFLMGSPEDEPERFDDEGPQHLVTLTRGFWLADTACTQALWRTVLGDNPGHFAGDPERPVDRVNWRQVQDFMRALEALLPGVRADLPTEAEWEYACRAGTTTPFSFGTTITPEQVNYDGNYPYDGGEPGLNREATVPVKSLPANPWGLYEMHGNVWEWCADGQRDYTPEPADDPLGARFGDSTPRVVRGGSWGFNARRARSAVRSQRGPGVVDSLQGFRLCLRSIEPGPEPARVAGAAPKGRGGEAGGPPGGAGLDRIKRSSGKKTR